MLIKVRMVMNLVKQVTLSEPLLLGAGFVVFFSSLEVGMDLWTQSHRPGQGAGSSFGCPTLPHL